MKNFLNISKKISIALGVVTLMFCSVSAAKLTIDAPSNALANRQPIVVQVFLDPEKDVLSGIASDFSFPQDLFIVSDISTEDSAVSLWVKQPSISLEKYLDNRTHIAFEGIFPGGFDGVRSPYYKGTSPGFLFSVTLIPKNSGQGALTIDDIVFNAFDKDASRLPSENIAKLISVPKLNPSTEKNIRVPQEIKNKNFTLEITRDPLINNNAWYLIAGEKESKSAISKIYVSESTKYSGDSVGDNEWRQASFPYVLLYQDRTRYVHVKVLYSNDTYVITTLAPVENSKSNHLLSRILISVLAALSLLYFYGKNIFIHFKKP